MESAALLSTPSTMLRMVPLPDLRWGRNPAADLLDPDSVIVTLERLQTLVRAYRMHYMHNKPARQALLPAGFAKRLS
jgi:hypothetical protein